MNENYQDFLLLGSSLHGGEEKVEEVRVGLLGFRRDVEGLKEKVEGQKKEVEGLLEQRKRIRGDVQVGMALLEVDERVGELEQRLMVASSNGDVQKEEDADYSDSEEDSEEESRDGVSTSRLKRHAQRYIYIRRLVDRIGLRIGPSHPFLTKQEERILRLRQTVLLDLGNALKQMSSTSDEDKTRLMKILGIYRDMGEPEEALKIFKERKR